MIKVILVILIVLCGSAAAPAAARAAVAGESPDPTELLGPPVAKDIPARDALVPERPATATVNRAVKPASEKTADNGYREASHTGEQVQAVSADLLSVKPVAQNVRSSSLEQQLWKDSISMFPEKDNLPERDQLQQLLERLRSVEFPRPRTDANFAEPLRLDSEKSLAAEPNKTESQDGRRAAAKSAGDANSADKTLGLIRQVCQNPEKVEDSLELADMLYVKGYLKEAAVFYQETLNRQKPDKKISPGQKAWILYQTGNCLRQTDPAAASAAYKQLIAEFPDCPWAASARVQEKVLGWLVNEKPLDLLKAAVK